MFVSSIVVIVSRAFHALTNWARNGSESCAIGDKKTQ